jgi:hypothetical protein
MNTDVTLKLAHGQDFKIDSSNDTHDPEEGKIRLVGFQQEVNVQRVQLFVDEWRKDPQSAVGMFPVFSRGPGGLFHFTMPVEEVEVRRTPEEIAAAVEDMKKDLLLFIERGHIPGTIASLTDANDHCDANELAGFCDGDRRAVWGWVVVGSVLVVVVCWLKARAGRELTFTATMAVDVETWAAEYHLSPEEVLDDVRSYLTTALTDLNEMLKLKGVLK